MMKSRRSRAPGMQPSPANFAPEITQKPLHFVQRGRILLRCGSAFALSLPSLGVSSLDLGRLFIQAALFSFLVIPGSLRFAEPVIAPRFARTRWRPGMTRSEKFYSAAARTGARSPSLTHISEPA